MQALRLESPRHFAPHDLPEPAEPGPGEAIVRVHNVGICGTDVSAYLGKMPFVTYPCILGHELGVEVVAVGSGVSNVRPGDRCSVEPYLNDPTSYASRRGRPNCCERLQVLGVHTDGGMRPYFAVPARKLHPAAGLAFEQLALVETLAIGCHAVDRSGLAGDESCLVIGAGPIGLATLEFVRLTGAKTIVVDVNSQRLDFCRRSLGIAHTLQPSDNLDGQLRDLCDGHLPDVVIDATGNPGSMSAAFGLIAQGGRLVFVGLTAEEVRFRHPTFHRPEGTLLCSRNALPGDFSRIIDLIGTGQIDTGPWITHRTPLADLPAAFPSYLRPETGVVKAVVEVSS
ncbi:MAG: zinc-binding alcohol dehydrogenase family protein [Pirellulaceae bacterium]|nr:zinc-binding alcohol dehydrogenase family protein [Pirellulaceae bacterium]